MFVIEYTIWLRITDTWGFIWQNSTQFRLCVSQMIDSYMFLDDCGVTVVPTACTSSMSTLKSYAFRLSWSNTYKCDKADKTQDTRNFILPQSRGNRADIITWHFDCQRQRSPSFHAKRLTAKDGNYSFIAEIDVVAPCGWLGYLKFINFRCIYCKIAYRNMKYSTVNSAMTKTRFSQLSA